MTKILVIEDDESIRGNIVEILEDEGLDVIEAENGLVGIKLAQEHLPQLILCDIMMPELDGYGVLTALRKTIETTTIPCIFLTAKDGKNDIRQGMNLGVDDYLTKPFKKAELIEAIKTRLQKRELLEKVSDRKLEDLRSNINHSLPHELLTPLNGIIGMSQLLAAEFDSMEKQEIQEMLEGIHTSGERLYYLIQNYLFYARLEIIRTDPDKLELIQNSKVDSAKYIIENVALREATLFKRKQDLELNIQDATIKITEENLSKLIKELVNNAFKFSEAGTQVRVQSSTINNQFVLSITNSGRGMTPEQITNIGAYTQFERRLYEQQGAGLGLIISRRLAELHNGKLTIASVPQEETTVQVLLVLDS